MYMYIHVCPPYILYLVLSGPMMALCLAREDAIGEWRKLLGPKELEEAIKEAPESYVDCGRCLGGVV